MQLEYFVSFFSHFFFRGGEWGGGGGGGGGIHLKFVCSYGTLSLSIKNVT